MKNAILEHYSCAIHISMEDVNWLKFENRQSGHKFIMCICYLLPEGSSRKCDGEAFYLMLKWRKQFYEYKRECKLSRRLYICTKLHKYTNFRVYPMSSVINDFNLQGHYRSTEHSILHVTLQHENLVDRIPLSDTPAAKTQYKLSDIPASFMNCEISFKNLMDAIQKIEMSFCEEQDVQQAYTDFGDLLRAEMDSKLQKRKHLKPNISNKPHKSKAKPYLELRITRVMEQNFVGVKKYGCQINWVSQIRR